MTEIEINPGDLVAGARSESSTWERVRVRVDSVRVDQQCHTVLVGEGVEVSVKDSTLEVIVKGKELDEAFELGRDRGWDHANFIAAYGKEHECRPTYPGSMALDPAEFGISYEESQARIREGDKRRALRSEFERGWSEGRENFRYCRYTDGTKIEG